MINWEIVRPGGNSGSFDYNVPGGVFGTPSTRFYLRLLKLEVACQIERTLENLSFFPISSFLPFEAFSKISRVLGVGIKRGSRHSDPRKD